MLTLDSAAGRWLLLAAVLGSGLAGIDATVVNVALPAIGESLDADFTTLQWTVSAYALTLASFILLGGVLGDRYGRRRVFLVGVVWFAVGSLLCGLAPTGWALVGARALQGVGGALLTPGSLAMIQASFGPGDRARAIGAWSGLGGVATAIGPFVGGGLVELGSWRWVFLVNVPLAALVVWVTLRHVPESRGPAEHGRLDLGGAVLGALALGALTWSLISAGETGPGPATVVAGGLGLLAALLFVAVERRVASPMLPLAVFAAPQLRAANAVTFVVYGGFGAIFFLLVVHLQVVSGFSPVVAGTALLPVTALMLVLSPRSGALAARIGPRRQMAAGPVVAAAGVVLMLRIGPGASYAADVLPAVVVLGLGLATMVSPLTATALAAAPPEHAGAASGINNAVARTAGLVAVAAIPVLAGLDGRVYADPVAFDAGFGTALLISAAVLLAGGALAALTVRDDVLGADDTTPPAPPLQLRHCAGVGGPPLATRVDAAGHADCDPVPLTLLTLDPEETAMSTTAPDQAAPACTHLVDPTPPEPGSSGCVECLADGGPWVHLRLCQECGHVGCCDSSPGRHATAHAHLADHPVVRSFEPGEEWFYCYVDDVALEVPGAPPAPSHP
ncbi:Multidrug resistance protein Stp [Nocardioides aquaticus]|uniref:Multidrug resistance protein Stp n=1 Tax=Nocardioides aquaticus TaxID=160826 RepID=A0ABX8ELE2_9ACTN|nr:MFS transporter [Nocardioides aquaticus]QVT81339.1 Multidrug resistance protein Stp [Nocardioides aquaticus]